MNVEKIKQLFEASTDKYGDAKKMGSSYQNIYNIIYKGRVCRVDLIERIAKFYNKPVAYFFDEIASTPSAKSKKDLEIAYLRGQVDILKKLLLESTQHHE